MTTKQELEKLLKEVESMKKDERFNNSDFYKEHDHVTYNKAIEEVSTLIKKRIGEV